VTPAERAARERKQKIFVAVGGLFLVALLAFQLPKLLGGSSSSEAASSSDTSTVPGASSPISAAQTAAAAANARILGTPASAVSQTPATTTLTSFSLFRPKDPFVQQVVTNAAASSEPVSPVRTPPAKGPQPQQAQVPAKGFTTGTSAAAMTIITVNGTRQVLQPGMKFPTSDPLFVLVAERPAAKSVVVGIAGGAYAGGAKTTTLKVGKPLTLVNTTTGAKYKISLVSVGSGDQSAQAAQTPKKP
jgi:hypothetical protein